MHTEPMTNPTDHYAFHLWEHEEIPFDETIDRPLTTSQLFSFLQDSRSHSHPRAQPYTSLCGEAIVSVKSIDQNGPEPETLIHILGSVIKPLFSNSPHAALTPEGRKNHYQHAGTNLNSKYDSTLFSEEAKPWKYAAKWSLPLLTWLVHQISLLPEASKRQDVSASSSSSSSLNNSLRDVFSGLTSLLAPPILHLIDDSSLPVKAIGATLLTTYCKTLSTIQSTTATITNQSSQDHPSQPSILVRTGLKSVFIDALTPNLSLLPTLVPETESLFILRRIYPAYIAVLDASSPSIPSPLPSSPLTTHTLTSLQHIQPSNPHLQTFLLTQLSTTLIPRLGPSLAPSLQRLLPLICRDILCNPFGNADLPVQRAAIAACTAVCAALPDRLRAKGWWTEILRGVVGCWVVVVLDDDDAGESSSGGAQNQAHVGDADPDADVGKETPTAMKAKLRSELKALVRTLRDVVDNGDEEEAFALAVKVLVQEEEELAGLFQENGS